MENWRKQCIRPIRVRGIRFDESELRENLTTYHRPGNIPLLLPKLVSLEPALKLCTSANRPAYMKSRQFNSGAHPGCLMSTRYNKNSTDQRIFNYRPSPPLPLLLMHSRRSGPRESARIIGQSELEEFDSINQSSGNFSLPPKYYHLVFTNYPSPTRAPLQPVQTMVGVWPQTGGKGRNDRLWLSPYTCTLLLTIIDSIGSDELCLFVNSS